MKYYGQSDIGLVRSENQDTFNIQVPFEGALISVVCDGMGGAASGALAASLACEAFTERLNNNIKAYINSPDDLSQESVQIIDKMLTDAAELANTVVYEKASHEKEHKGMGTTLVASLVIGKFVYVINIGDSRLYRRTSLGFTQITRDHSYVQALIDIGKISVEEATHHPNRNIITRAVGTNPEVVPDIYHIIIGEGESILLCSDGLCGYVEADEIDRVMTGDVSEKDKVEELIALAKDAGGRDNITAVVVTY